jgi:hypothetical protein
MDKQTWLSDAYAAFARFVKRTRKPFTIEQARASVAPRIDEPADLRWWGIVTKAAKRDGLIRAVGFKPAKSSHHALKPTWTRGQA